MNTVLAGRYRRGTTTTIKIIPQISESEMISLMESSFYFYKFISHLHALYSLCKIGSITSSSMGELKVDGMEFKIKAQVL